MTSYIRLKSYWFLKRNRRALGVFLLVVCLVAAVVPLQAAQSPFAKRQDRSESAAEIGTIDTIVQYVNQAQLKARNEISSLIRQFNDGHKATALIALAVISFLYGLLHALGPGHGKSIVMSYMLSEDQPSVSKGILVGSIIAFGEALSAIILVYGIYYFSLGRIKPLFDHSVAGIQMVSYLFLAGFGTVLLLFRIKKRWPILRKNPQAPSDSARVKSSKNSFLVAASLGIIPCPGVMILLVFLLTMKLPLIGIALALTMALGMAITISLFGSAVALTKSGTLRLLSANHDRMERFETALELAGAALIIIIALMLLLNM